MAVLRFTLHLLPYTALESEARTPPGKRRVSDFGELSRAARWGWAGEKSDFFSILEESLAA